MDNPYLPPTAIVRDAPEIIKRRRRPLWVWIASAYMTYAAIITAANLVNLFATESHSPYPGIAVKYYIYLVPTMQLAAAVYLFRLKRSAIIFCSAYVLLLAGLRVVTMDWSYPYFHPSLIDVYRKALGANPYTFGLVVAIGIAMYAIRLGQRSILK